MTTPMFDRREMIMVHDALRREIGLMPRTVRGTPSDDIERVQFVGDHVAGVTALLHHHHASEDAMLWPLLEERCQDTVARVAHLMETQHQKIAGLSQDVDTTLSAWRDVPSARTRDNLVKALEKLLPALHEHLTAEEDQILPVMEERVTAEEWNDMVRRGAATADPDSMPLMFGMMMYEGDPEIVEAALASMPADVAPIIRKIAPEAYGAHAQVLYGTATPPRSNTL